MWVRRVYCVETCMGVSSQFLIHVKSRGVLICVPSVHFRTQAYAMFRDMIQPHRGTERQRESACGTNDKRESACGTNDSFT